MRRLPVYILINNTTSVSNETLQTFENCIDLFVASLRKYPEALESVFLSIIGFDKTILCPLSPLATFEKPQISSGKNKDVSLYDASLFLIATVNNEKIKNTCDRRGDYKPLVYIMTETSCSLLHISNELKKLEGRIFIKCMHQLNFPEGSFATAEGVYVDNFDEDSVKKQLVWIDDAIECTQREISLEAACADVFTDDEYDTFFQLNESEHKEILTFEEARFSRKENAERLAMERFKSQRAMPEKCYEFQTSPYSLNNGYSFTPKIKNSVKRLKPCIRRNRDTVNNIYSSIFAPAEVKRKSHLQVQVYLHLYEETEEVIALAQEADENAKRRGYIPLSLKLRKGDRVDVEFNIYGEKRLMSERKSVIWQGVFTKCTFDYVVPLTIDIDELSCEANILVNGAMIGEMRFITKIVENPRHLNPKILSHRFRKIFISYSHADAQQIKLLALAYKAQGIDYFYDRDSLAPGDVYEEKIFDYIDTADLFILCWSQNAADSQYVAKEKGRALLRAYPQLSLREATLKIYPISIEPRADLPDDMINIYNFEVI